MHKHNMDYRKIAMNTKFFKDVREVIFWLAEDY